MKLKSEWLTIKLNSLIQLSLTKSTVENNVKDFL